MNQTNKTPLPDGRIWFVRANEGNALAEFFVAQEIVSMGWCIGPLQPDESKPEIIRRLTEQWPEKEAGTFQVWASNILRFNRQMAAGHAIATYNSQKRICHLGIIRSTLIPDIDRLAPLIDAEMKYEPGYHTCHDYAHSVEWLYEVSRDDLSGPAWRGLVNPQTLFLLSESTSAELQGLCAR